MFTALPGKGVAEVAELCMCRWMLLEEEEDDDGDGDDEEASNVTMRTCSCCVICQSICSRCSSVRCGGVCLVHAVT